MVRNATRILTFYQSQTSELFVPYLCPWREKLAYDFHKTWIDWVPACGVSRWNSLWSWWLVTYVFCKYLLLVGGNGRRPRSMLCDWNATTAMASYWNLWQSCGGSGVCRKGGSTLADCVINLSFITARAPRRVTPRSTGAEPTRVVRNIVGRVVVR